MPASIVAKRLSEGTTSLAGRPSDADTPGQRTGRAPEVLAGLVAENGEDEAADDDFGDFEDAEDAGGEGEKVVGHNSRDMVI